MRASSRGGSSAERPQRRQGGPWLDSPLLRKVSGGRWCLLQPPAARGCSTWNCGSLPAGRGGHAEQTVPSIPSPRDKCSSAAIIQQNLLTMVSLDLRFSFETSTQRCRKDPSVGLFSFLGQLRRALQSALPRYKGYALGLQCFSVRGVSPECSH